jgi:hypothetical protein
MKRWCNGGRGHEMSIVSYEKAEDDDDKSYVRASLRKTGWVVRHGGLHDCWVGFSPLITLGICCMYAAALLLLGVQF